MPKLKGDGKCPKWWKKLRGFVGNRLPCQDHTSFSKDGKYVYFEPYEQPMEEIEKLILFCKNNNLEFDI